MPRANLCFIISGGIRLGHISSLKELARIAITFHIYQWILHTILDKIKLENSATCWIILKCYPNIKLPYLWLWNSACLCRLLLRPLVPRTHTSSHEGLFDSFLRLLGIVKWFYTFLHSILFYICLIHKNKTLELSFWLYFLLLILLH